MNGCQAARSGGKILFKGLYSGLAGNLAGVLPSVTSRTLSFGPVIFLYSAGCFMNAICNKIRLLKDNIND